LKSVLIISTTRDEQTKLEEVARFHDSQQISIETTGSFGQDITFWTSQAPDVLILSLPEDDFLQGYFFTKLRKDVPSTQPLICLCSVISAPLMQLSLQFSKIRMLKAPVEGFTLYRAVIDLLQDYKGNKRQVHPRYLTEQPIEIRSDFNPGVLRGNMKNLSMSGAYFESSDLAWELKAGDFVKITVLPSAQSKQYTFDVKIVWCKDQDAGNRGFGVTFVNKEDVYNHLLKNI
jgi:hypothetical protein